MLIPAAIIFGLYTHETTAVMKQEIYNSVVLDQQYAASLLDSQIKNFQNMSNQFQLTRGFRSYADSHNFYSSSIGETYGEIIEDLFTLHQMNPFAENFFVYFHDKDCAFSTKGLHQIRTFITAEYQYEKYTPAQYLELLDQAKAPVVLGSQTIMINGKSKEYITFIYPLFENFEKVAATTVFCVETSLMNDMFSSRISEYNASIYLWDNHDVLVTSYHPLSDELMQDSTYLEQNYYKITNTSSDTGWRSLTLLPKNQPVVYKLANYGRNFFLFSIFALLLSFIVVFYMMRINYNPIRRLKEKASGITDDHPDNSHTELETISHALDYLQEQNSLLNSTIISQQTMIANNRLRRLLNGDYDSIKDFNSDCASSLHYSYQNFFVAIILFHKKDALTEAAAQDISNILEQYFESNYIYHLEPDKLITINAIPDHSLWMVTDAFCSMLKSLNQSQAFSATVGVGNITQCTTDIGRSFMEAQSAIDYRFVKGKGTVILYSDIHPAGDTVPAYPYGQFERLNNALAAGDDVSVNLQINDILSYILTGNIPLFLARGICFDILRTIDENNRRSGSGQALLDVTVLQQLSGSDTARDTVSILQKLLTHQTKNNYSETMSTQNLISQVKAYIRKHCCSCDFSVQELSDTFHMLPSNLSALFKSQTGETILDHVTGLRMERAKKLLKTTDLNLNDISMSVGYYNTSSFIRRFKKHQGITPGAYRDSV